MPTADSTHFVTGKNATVTNQHHGVSERDPPEAERVVAVHHLKCWPEFFQMIVDGKKPFEVRLNDRDFREGDMIVGREWNPERAAKNQREADGYTGRSVGGVILSVSRSAYLEVGYVVMGVAWQYVEECYGPGQPLIHRFPGSPDWSAR